MKCAEDWRAGGFNTMADFVKEIQNDAIDALVKDLSEILKCEPKLDVILEVARHAAIHWE
jgi:hypothetical protein